MSTQMPPVATTHEPIEPPFPPALVEELLKVLGKAMRAHQLYLPNNPVYQRAIDNLKRAFLPVWAHVDEIALAITESDFRWEGRSVMRETSKSESVPWIFFKDGIRELRLLKGFEEQEVVGLLDILKRVKKASPEEDDLLTLIWEKDFSFLRYRFIDLTLENNVPIEASVPAERPPVAPPEQMEPEPEARPGIVRIEDLDATVHFLDESEIDYLRTEVQKEYSSEVRRNVLAILLDIFELQTAKAVRDEISDILENFLMHLLSAGHFSTVAYVLRESQELLTRARELDSSHRTKLVGLPDRLSAAGPLSNLLQAMDDGATVPNQAELNELFEQLRPSALGTLFTWLGRLQHTEVRAAIEIAAARLAAANTAELVKLIGSADVEVVLESARRAGGLKTAAAVAPLGKLLGHEAPKVRLAAVQALSEINSAGALQQLERAVDDEDRDVRVAAVRILGSRGQRGALAKVEAAVKGRALRDADLTEKMAFFEAYGSLAAAAGVAYLDALLNGKGFLGKREDPEMRACAAMALGKIGTHDAADALSRAQGDKDVLVRNAVNRAVRESAA
ncbi:MAG TPA: HEAT repeat domain-containing protein [Gemmatimonadaceae bacterium]|nr:HEAT repeat domain-containing protein [Gemmatimonadaceae bacterium]